MSDDWETQLEEETIKEETNKFAGESEEIVKPQVTQVKTEQKQEVKVEKVLQADGFDFKDTNRTVIRDVKPAPEKLNLEKDFIDLAAHNVGKVQQANKPSRLTLLYLKQNLDLLAPTLDADKLDELIQDLKVIYNKKVKTSSKPVAKKKIPSTTNIEKVEVKQPEVVIKQEVKTVSREEYNDDDFM